MQTGTVKWFDPARGYGSVEPEDRSQDVYVHVAALKHAGLSTLVKGQRLQYEINLGRDGRRFAWHLVLVG